MSKRHTIHVAKGAAVVRTPVMYRLPVDVAQWVSREAAKHRITNNDFIIGVLEAFKARCEVAEPITLIPQDR
jgi:presenilin-like A22 family membrane protease